MRRPFGRGRSEEETEEINLTPMLDVVFIMLIFFIVTATFVKEVGLDVNQPDDDKPKTVDPDKKALWYVSRTVTASLLPAVTSIGAQYAPTSNGCTLRIQKHR
jgi:biopolymer transport protein ExbD